MDNQNNMFSNMIQPNAVPEIKDSPSLPQGNVGVNNVSNGSLNQSNDILGFGIPQNNVVNNTGINSGVSPSNVGDLNNNVNQVNNVMPDLGGVMPSVGVPPVDNSSLNNSANLNGGVVSSNAFGNGLEPQLQTMSNSNNVAATMGTSTQAIESSNAATSSSAPVNNISNVSNNNNVVKNSDSNVDAVPVTKYLVHMILCMIPIAGFIILIVRAVNNQDKNIRNLSRAQLILSAVSVVLSIVGMALMGASIMSMLGGY